MLSNTFSMLNLHHVDCASFIQSNSLGALYGSFMNEDLLASLLMMSHRLETCQILLHWLDKSCFMHARINTYYAG